MRRSRKKETRWYSSKYETRCEADSNARYSLASSSGSTTVSAVSPCRNAFLLDRRLPSSVRGPVLIRAFLRLASICRGVVIAAGTECRAAHHLPGVSRCRYADRHCSPRARPQARRGFLPRFHRVTPPRACAPSRGHRSRSYSTTRPRPHSDEVRDDASGKAAP